MCGDAVVMIVCACVLSLINITPLPRRRRHTAPLNISRKSTHRYVVHVAIAAWFGVVDRVCGFVIALDFTTCFYVAIYT